MHPARLDGLVRAGDLVAYHLGALPFSVDDLALTALVRILPRSRYRLAGQTDSRFQSFASNSFRIAYRQQGATPAFLLFSGPGQNPQAAAMAAASWAEANWRPNAIQRKVRPGVVVVHVAPGNQLTPAGPVAGAAVPAAVWTVDSATGKAVTSGNPPGSPPAGEIRQAANNLMRGAPAPSLGELDAAERSVMQLRTIGAPRLFTGVVSICLLVILLRFGLGGLFALFTLPVLIGAGDVAAVGEAVVSVLILAGILLGLALVFNVRNLAYRTPGFSSTFPRTRNLTWAGYAVAMLVLLGLQQGVMPAIPATNSAGNSGDQSLHVTATTTDDGGDTYVALGGRLTVDLTGWPSSEWDGVTFKSSNPSVLHLDGTDTGRPVARFTGRQSGVARVDATSADGTYTFQLRVDVGEP